MGAGAVPLIVGSAADADGDQNDFELRPRKRHYTNRLCSIAAAMKLAKSGCGSKGRDFNSG